MSERNSSDSKASGGETPKRAILRLRSSIPGRERWESGAVYGQPELAQQVQSTLIAEFGVVEAEVNSFTGRILIIYDAAKFEGSIERLILETLSLVSERQPVGDKGHSQPDGSLFFRILALADSRKGQFEKAAAWTVVSVLVAFLPTWGLSTLMSVRKSDGAVDTKKKSFGLLGLLTAALNAADWFVKHHQRQRWKEFASQVEHELYTKALAHVESLDMAFFDRQSIGQLQSVLSGDISTVGRFLQNGPSNAIQAFATAMLSMASIAVLSPAIALIVGLPACGVVLLSRYFQRRIGPLYAQFADDSAELNMQLANSLSGIATVKSFAAEQREAERARQISDRRRLSYGRAIAASSRNASFLHGTIYSMAAAASVAFGAMCVARGSLSDRSFQAIAQLVPRFFGATSQIDDIYDTYVNSELSAQRVLALFDAQPLIRDGERFLPPDEVRGDIAFRGVSFSYKNGVEILRNVNLEIGRGETAGIVGATGAGKTTIAKLLLRFYDVDAGTVTIDGVDIKDAPVKDLREAIGFVSQDVYLFDGTVYDNIEFGRPGASFDQVMEAASAAEAHDFIMRLPNGYRSRVGERGQLLSMGQRQRISIARTVIKGAPIIILDEATASVDNETEAAIHRSIERVARGRSMIVIAHRLSTIRNATRIYVIDDGSVVEQGTHEELLARAGLYASLWNVQTGNRTPSP
jgi:ATP-binding cassette, subfamily B, bacterial